MPAQKILPQKTLPSTQHKKSKGNLYSATCPTRSVLDHVTSRWGSLILVLLLEGTHRFSELRRRIGGVSEKMLAQTLQALEADGFVRRTVYATVPPKVEYNLTPLGRELSTRLQVLTSWVEANAAAVLRFREKQTHGKGAAPVALRT